MKKYVNNPWMLGIGTTVIGGVLLSFVMDWINKVDWLSTLKAVISFIAKAVIAFLNYELKVWWVLVAIAVLFVLLVIYVKILDAKPNSNPTAFLSYRTDFVLGYSWEWDYEKSYDGKYTISNLHPVCSECGMRLKRGGPYGLAMECLRCNTTQTWTASCLTDARMLIEDNIKKKYLRDQ